MKYIVEKLPLGVWLEKTSRHALMKRREFRVRSESKDKNLYQPKSEHSLASSNHHINL